MDYCSFRLSKRFQYYDDDYASRAAKPDRSLKAQLKSQMFDGSDAISNLCFIPALQMAFDTDWIHEESTMRIFQFFIKKNTGAAPTYVPVCPFRSLHISKGK